MYILEPNECAELGVSLCYTVDNLHKGFAGATKGGRAVSLERNDSTTTITRLSRSLFLTVKKTKRLAVTLHLRACNTHTARTGS